ncbi:unnamed protein product, partial [Closterium sp. NIES-53]
DDFECLAAAVPQFASMLLALEGDPDAPDIPISRSYAEAITDPYSSQRQAAMDAEMASWKVKRPPGSPPAFKARYVARGFRQPAQGDLAAFPTWLHWVISCRYPVESPPASEWVRTKILEEDFRRRQLRGGDDGSSGYGMQGSRRGRGRGFGGAGRGAKKDDDSNDQQGGTGWGRGAKSGRGGKSGQFFHIGEQGEQGDASAKVGAELHPLDYWVLDTGAAWTMTPRKELLDDVAGAGRAAFKGADGKLVVLHDVLLVPDLKANLISLRKLAKAGVSTSTDGARTYKGQLGNRVLWDLHESKDVY